ncbi:unnamed protein product [Orchesella dallaii]|uniref:Uncharacterized protein n=1 Tax=Orchesella dallaii TaxID=48710 RepID=A0ABP1R8X3_9HEXA
MVVPTQLQSSFYCVAVIGDRVMFGDHLRNPASVLKLLRDLEKLKQQNESSSDDAKASTSGGCALLSPHAKVDKLFKSLDEFRTQLTRSIASLVGIRDQWPMSFETVTTPRLQHSGH